MDPKQSPPPEAIERVLVALGVPADVAKRMREAMGAKPPAIPAPNDEDDAAMFSEGVRKFAAPSNPNRDSDLLRRMVRRDGALAQMMPDVAAASRKRIREAA